MAKKTKKAAAPGKAKRALPSASKSRKSAKSEKSNKSSKSAKIVTGAKSRKRGGAPKGAAPRPRQPPPPPAPKRSADGASLAELQASLDAARADARAARDEVARLAGEAEAVRARLDAVSHGATDGTIDVSGLERDLERSRTEASLARLEAAALRDDLDRERLATLEARARAEEAAKTWRAQVEEARADAARADATARETAQQLQHALSEAAKLRAELANALEGRGNPIA